LIGGGYYLWETGQLPFFSNVSAAEDNNIVSGYIEGTEYQVTSEIAARVSAVNVDEGARVQAGQVLVELDHTLLDAQIAQAQAAVKTAEAQLALVQKSARPSDIAAAQAALKAAQENYDKLTAGAKASDLAAAQAALKAAQENYAKVRKGPTADDLAPLKAQVDNAKAALDQAQAAYDKIGGASNPNIAL